MPKNIYDGPSFFRKYPQEKQKYLEAKRQRIIRNRKIKNQKKHLQRNANNYSHASTSFDKFVPTGHQSNVQLQHNSLLDMVNKFHPGKLLFNVSNVFQPFTNAQPELADAPTSSMSSFSAKPQSSAEFNMHNTNISHIDSTSVRILSAHSATNSVGTSTISSIKQSASLSASTAMSAQVESIHNNMYSHERRLLHQKYNELKTAFQSKLKSMSNSSPTVSSKVTPTVTVNKPATKAPISVDLDAKKQDIYRDTTNYSFPSSASLVRPIHKDDKELKKWILHKGKALNQALNAYHVNAKVTDWTNGPTVTQFQVQVHLGVKVEKIRHLANDLKMALAAKSIRVQAPIPGQTTCGVEIPNPKPRPVMLSEVLDSKAFRDAKSPLTIALGVDLEGKPRVTDLRKMPHGLIAGATGSGKSVFINCMLISLLYKATPRQLRLILIDPKAVELAPYNGIPHLITPVISKPKQATAALHWCVKVMNNRYRVLEKAHVRNIEQYNQKMDKLHQPEKKMPYIVIVIDELADLMMVASNAVETYIVRITQKARAAGLHLIVATQRPSVDIVTGTIKNNIPTRIAFMVSSQVDSRTIIDTGGAERLLGKGDMLYLGNGHAHPIRLQGCFVGNKEIDKIVKQVKSQAHAHYDFQPKVLSQKVNALKHQDKLLPRVLAYLSHQSTISTSKLQRVFSIGYNRSAKIIDTLQKRGYVSSQDGSKPRKVLLSNQDYQQLKLKLK